MGFPDAYKTSLLTTLCCVVPPLLIIVAHLCREQPWLVLSGTGKASKQHAAESTGHPAQETTTTYRIRGIPCDWDQSRLQAFFDDKSAKLTVRSLAPEIRGDEKTATCTFHGPRPSKPPNLAPFGVDHDFYGMTTLYAPSSDDHKVDIVAISGLGGHAFGSFKAKKAVDYMWPRDCLPQHIVDEETKRPMARIMTYGYDSRVADSNSFQSLQSLATSFSHSLFMLAEASAAPKPILIVAHSLGGLVVKQAMIELSKSTHEDTAKLYRAVYGIVFFGVPHDGMKIDHLLPMVGDGPNRFFVESLSSVNSMITEDASRNFPSDLGGEGESEIFCFYETEKTPIPEKTPDGSWKMSKDRVDILVSKSSATRYCSRWGNGLEHECAIARNHSNMVKFEPHDNEYDNVRGTLAGIAKRARLRKPKIDASLEREARRNLQELSDKLAFEQMNSKHEDLKGLPQPGTCQWLFHSEEFGAWKAGHLPGQDERPSILLLAGKPGCGKSVLMMTAQEEERNQSELPGQATLGFYFDARPNMSTLQKSSVGFYRSLLYQLLKKLGQLEVETLIQLERSLSESISYDTSSAVLQQSIFKTLNHMAARMITIFLDGLDECTGGSMDDTTEAIGVLKFLNKLSSTGVGVRICMSARSPTSFGIHLKPTHTVWVDRRNGDDIRTFLQGKLADEEMIRPELRQQILRRVHARASNIFLWVDLVVARIESKLGSGKSDQYLLDLIDAMPKQLPPLYRSLLNHIDAFDRSKIQAEARVLFQHVQAAARPLTVVEAGGLLDFVTGDDGADPPHQLTVAQLENHIRFVSCGLIECRPDASDPDQPVSVLRFIHKSVGDFVLEERDPLITGNPGTTVGTANEAQSQFHLNAAKRCMQIVQQAIDYKADDRKDPPAMLPYAAQFWMLHARKGEGAMGTRAAENANAYPRFVTQCEYEAELAVTWYKQHLAGGSWAHAAMDDADVPNERFVRRERCMLVLLAFEGCTRLMAQHIEDGCPCCGLRASSSPSSSTPPSSSIEEIERNNNMEEGEDDDAGVARATLQRAVFLASLRGYDATVRVLLNSAEARGITPGAVADAHYEGRETALASACFRGHLACVRTLLERGADASVEARQTRYGLPLHAAAAQGYLEVVRLVLLQQRTRGPEAFLSLLAQEDAQGYSAAQVAVETGRPDVLRALLAGAAAVADRAAVRSLLQQLTGLGVSAYAMAKGMRDAAKGAHMENEFERMVAEMEKYLLSG